MSLAKKTLFLAGGALVCLAIVAGIGLYQFDSRARDPVEIVRSQPLKGTGGTIGEGIGDYLKASGIKVVSEGFKPTWGAEQVSDDEWIVNYIFEVGRESRWASWTVNTRTGQLKPRNDLARRMQAG